MSYKCNTQPTAECFPVEGKLTTFNKCAEAHPRMPNKVGREECKKPISEAYQSDDESWKGSDENVDKATDMETVRSFKFNSI